MTITIQLPKKAAQILREMAAATGKSEDAIAFDALMERIEDWHDLKIVDERMKNDDGVRIPLEDIVRELEAREVAGRAMPLNELDNRLLVQGQKRPSQDTNY